MENTAAEDLAFFIFVKILVFEFFYFFVGVHGLLTGPIE